MNEINATLRFPTMDLAEKFGVEWSRYTFEGRDRSSLKKDGSVEVKIYHVNEERKKWIESWISNNS
jgi:hypothetical protein